MRQFRGKRPENLLTGQVQGRTGFRIGKNDTVKADLDLGDADAVLRAHFEFARLDAARRVGDVGMLDADTGAEEFQATARTGRFNNRGLEVGLLAELFSDRR